MTQRKKLIEVALPLEAINVASVRESYIYKGNPSAFHKWWAQRPLAAARAVIFTSLVDDPDSELAPKAFVEACKQLDGNQFNYENKYSAETDTPRMRLFDFIAHLVTWESTTDEKMLEKARELILLSTDGNPPPLLDPFAGGGSIPLEAQRLGLESHASDLNPVAVMINKAQIEIPPRFADMPPVNPRDRENDTGGNAVWKGAAGLAADVRYYGKWIRDQAHEKIGHLYPTHNDERVIAWLWARTVGSPNPAVNIHVPLVRSFILSKKKGRECWARPIIENNIIRFEVTKGKPPKDQDGTMGRKFGGGKCIISNEPMSWDYIRSEGKAGRMSVMLMAIVTEGPNGRSYFSPTVEHSQTVQNLKPEWLPDFALPINPRDFKTPLYGLETFADLFTSRQLIALTTFSNFVAEASEQAHADALKAGLANDDINLRDAGDGAQAYAEAIRVYLAFALNKLSMYSNAVVTWYSKEDRPSMLFSRQAIPMVWDYTEINPFSEIGGTFQKSYEIISEAFEAIVANADGIAQQADAHYISSKSVIVSTDPPYYDNISYADLSDFFYIWMRKNLRSIYPEIFGTMLVPKEPELIASTYRHGGKEEANQHFESGMLQTFRNIRQFVIAEYPLTVYYAFKQQDADIVTDSTQIASTGWETMLTSTSTN